MIVPWVYLRGGSATVTNLVREAETALKIDVLQNARLDYYASYRNESAQVMNNSPRGNLRFNRAAVSRTSAHTTAIIPLDPRRSFAPINILSETRRCRFQWKQKLIVSPRRRTEPLGESAPVKSSGMKSSPPPRRSPPPSIERKMSNRCFSPSLRYPFFSRPQKCNERYSRRGRVTERCSNKRPLCWRHSYSDLS